jgi:hypothetical protein
LKAICSYCGEDLGYRAGPEGMITHGVCERCARIVLAEYKERKERPPLEMFLIATRTERAARMKDMPKMVTIPLPRDVA